MNFNESIFTLESRIRIEIFDGCLMLLLPSCVGLERTATTRVTDRCHSLLSCRGLNKNDLTELPIGLFDSLDSLNFLYVLFVNFY